MANSSKRTSNRQGRGSDRQDPDRQSHRLRDEGSQYIEVPTQTPPEHYYRTLREHPGLRRTNIAPETQLGRSHSYNKDHGYSSARVQDTRYAEHHVSYEYPHSRYNAQKYLPKHPNRDSSPLPQPSGIRHSQTTPEVSLTTAYIAPILPEHRGRTRNSMGKLAHEHGLESQKKRGQVSVEADVRALPYIAPILPEHRREISNARRSMERAHAQGHQGRRSEGEGDYDCRSEVNHAEGKTSYVGKGGEAERDRTREPYPTVNARGPNTSPRHSLRGHRPWNEQENFTHTPHHTDEATVYTYWQPDHKPRDDEFDYIYEPEKRILTVNLNPTRK